ncbi:hypothetical protein C8Q75DRAFT_732978 [Abortiporus biennis]|nr:hypothetical protein C8Q75DRAFT_732978 [Abortiporus biennis]
MAGNLLPHGWDPTSIWLESYFHKPKTSTPIHFYIFRRKPSTFLVRSRGHGGYALADVVSESGAALELRISGSEGSASQLNLRARSNSGEVTKTDQDRRSTTASFFLSIHFSSFLLVS